MLYLFSGTDRKRSQDALERAVKQYASKRLIVRITDAHSLDDLRSALRGGGLFGEKRAVVLDGVFANAEMGEEIRNALPSLKNADEPFFVIEAKLDADTRKKIEKYAEASERFDVKKERDSGEIFALANALKKGDKKELWVAYQRALTRSEAPEAIHGVLFWGAKDMFLKSTGAAQARAGRLVAELAELPHESRRKGFELEYALEYYIVSINKT